MEFKIEPYFGAGCVKFGMKKEDIRKCFNYQFKEFKKTPISKTLTDDFGICHIYYKTNNLCEAIEFFEGEVLFYEQRLFERPYEEVCKIFESYDSSLDFNDVGFTSFKFGVGIFAPFSNDEPDKPIESIIVFERGYYD